MDGAEYPISTRSTLPLWSYAFWNNTQGVGSLFLSRPSIRLYGHQHCAFEEVASFRRRVMHQVRQEALRVQDLQQIAEAEERKTRQEKIVIRKEDSMANLSKTTHTA
jgi:hypothetical protein